MKNYIVDIIGNGGSVMFTSSIDAESKSDAEFKASGKFKDSYGFYPEEKSFYAAANING